VTIHSSDPFATPEGGKSRVRRLRGRLPSAVTLWTAKDSTGSRAGLTVSSTVVVDGDPGRVLGVLDEEAALWEVVQRTRRFTVAPLTDADRQLADKFAGLLPAPGGAFAAAQWRETDFGPVLTTATTWAGCRLDDSRPMGWGLLIEATIEHVEIGAEGDAPSLIHYQGRYGTVLRHP